MPCGTRLLARTVSAHTMKNFLFLIFLILSPYRLLSQDSFMNFAKSDQHNIEAFFLPQNAQTNLKLFSEADGVVLETLANRVDQEEFIILEILDNRNGWFKVKTIYYTHEATGWVEPYTLQVRVGQLEQYTPFRNKPFNDASVSDSLLGKYYSTLVEINGDWRKVEVKIDSDRTISGWIFKNTCGNPYTYCN